MRKEIPIPLFKAVSSNLLYIIGLFIYVSVILFYQVRRRIMNNTNYILVIYDSFYFFAEDRGAKFFRVLVDKA